MKKEKKYLLLTGIVSALLILSSWISQQASNCEDRNAKSILYRIYQLPKLIDARNTTLTGEKKIDKKGHLVEKSIDNQLTNHVNEMISMNDQQTFDLVNDNCRMWSIVNNVLYIIMFSLSSFAIYFVIRTKRVN